MLLRAHPATRIVFTSREPLSAPFNHRPCEIGLGALSRDDAIELVSRVMKQEGLKPKYDDAGNTPQEIEELVAAVGCHARALTLLARETARQGVRATTENVRRLMAELEREHPGDRENSLYASVELSLRRLPPNLREQVKVLAVFHGGAQLRVLGMVLEAEEEAVQRLAAALIEVGLAEAMPYGHLRLDPALPGYLLGQMSAAERELDQSHWAGGMRCLTELLYLQHFQDAQLAARLTLLELPNLLALLAWAQNTQTPEEVVNLAGRMESLLAPLGSLKALGQVTRAREQAALTLSAWNHAQFESSRQSIERLLEQGRLPEAYAAAEQLLQRALAANETAYVEATYDLAGAHFFLGRVLKRIGRVKAALSPFREAQKRFQALADAGNAGAPHMSSAAILEIADCLRDLGQYDEAAAAFEEGIQRFDKLGDQRWAAVGRGNLGTVRLHQKRYSEALECYGEALRIFELLGEPKHVSIYLHQIGRAHREDGQFEKSEQAYRQSLAIKVQQHDRAGEAHSLGELGNLYDQIGQLEEAATFFRQAAEIYALLQDKRYEGVARSGLAGILIKLQRYNEARCELRRAIEFIEPFSHVARPWTAWHNLYNLEQAIGNAQAAAEARGQAVASYLAYRRAGGESQSNQAELFALVFQAIQQGTTTAAGSTLDELAKEELPLWAKTLLAKLRAILGGDRAPALAADPNLDYMNAAELQLLLEALGAK
jgi:tetratricopeptide (TPR) repeat protein/NTP pyrophosphatase (non-canonical NTP hydrolase)